MYVGRAVPLREARIFPEPSPLDKAASALWDQFIDQASKPARQCVVVDVSDKGEAELVLPIVFKCRKDAEEYARKRAKDEPGLTFSVFEIVSRSRVPSAQAVTTPA